MVEKADINNTLKQYFGFDSFRKGQDEIILKILEGKNTLVIMPTGGGKSMCYQLPALHFEGTALVISPLIALMQDQVGALTKRGIPAAFINSSLSYEESARVMENACAGKYKLLYIAPERLENRRFIEAVKGFDISFLAVDEAHCISEWGHDFRPSYLYIAEALKFFEGLPVIALTATATPDVQDDIVKSLGMKECQRFIRGFDRPNLSYMTELCEDKVARIVDICKETKEGSTIIYCGSRKKVESVTQGMNELGLSVISYHAGMHDKFRKFAQEKFINGDSNIIVATSAFGMGIDKADVRNVIHCDLTPTIEAYYQEAGRAGRDNKTSKCVLLYQPSDRRLQEFFINATFPPVKEIEAVYNYLYDLNSVPLGAKVYESIFLSDSEIGNKLGMTAIAVHSIINLLERNKILKRGSTQGIATVRITTSHERIIEYYNNIDFKKQRVLEALMRGVSAEVFDKPVEFDIQHFMRKYDIPLDDLKNAIKSFEFSRLLNFSFPGFNKGLSLILERMLFSDLPIDFDAYLKRRNGAIKKLNIVQQYAETKDCKRNFILNYFRDNESEGTCGTCSSCTDSTIDVKEISAKQKYLQRKIIESAYELNGNFGKITLMNYVKGSSNDSIIKHNLNKGSLYASCKEFRLDAIKHTIEKAIFENQLITSNDRYSTLMPNEELLSDLKHITQLELTQFKKFTDTDLFHKLKEVRRALAEKNKVVERAIISDASLKQIATKKPEKLEQITKIKGVGPVFVNNFAKYFLDVINKKDIHFGSQEELLKISPKVNEILKELNSGKGFDDLTKIFKMNKIDIIKEIQPAIEAGISIKTSHLIDNNLIAQVKNVLDKKPKITLKEIRNHLKTEADFADLRLALILARRLSKQ